MTALEAIDRELERLHKELDSFTLSDDDSCAQYESVLSEVSKMNEVLIVTALRETQKGPQ